MGNGVQRFDTNFLLWGTVVAHPIIPNPSLVGAFGSLVGRPATFGGGFDATGEETTLVMLGGMAAGDHVTMSVGLPDDMRPNGTALGSLVIDNHGPNFW